MQRWQKIYWHLNKAYVFESRFSWPIGQPKFVWHKLPMATNFICSDPLTASNFNASRAFAEAAVTCFSKPFLHLCNWTLHHETLFFCFFLFRSLLLTTSKPSCLSPDCSPRVCRTSRAFFISPRLSSCAPRSTWSGWQNFRTMFSTSWSTKARQDTRV